MIVIRFFIANPSTLQESDNISQRILIASVCLYSGINGSFHGYKKILLTNYNTLLLCLSNITMGKNNEIEVVVAGVFF